MALQRPLRGSRISTFYPVNNLPSLSSLDSAFQLQEHMSHLIRLDVHDVDAQGGPGLSGPHPLVDAIKRMLVMEKKSVNVDEACWTYEQLRRLAQDLSHPLVTMLQQVCTRTTCPEMKAGEWLYLNAAQSTTSYTPSTAQQPYSTPRVHFLPGEFLSGFLIFHRINSPPPRLQIPPASHRRFTSLVRRPGRILAHAYSHHHEEFEQAEAESSLYARFLALTENVDFVRADFLVIPPRAVTSVSGAGAVLRLHRVQRDLQRPSHQRPEPAFFASVVPRRKAPEPRTTSPTHRATSRPTFQRTVHPNPVELQRIVTIIQNPTQVTIPTREKDDKNSQIQSNGVESKRYRMGRQKMRMTFTSRVFSGADPHLALSPANPLSPFVISYDGALFAQAHNLLTKKPQLEASSAPRSRRTRTRYTDAGRSLVAALAHGRLLLCPHHPEFAARMRAFVADDRAMCSSRTSALRPSTQQDSQRAVDSSRRTAALRSRRTKTERICDETSSPVGLHLHPRRAFAQGAADAVLRDAQLLLRVLCRDVCQWPHASSDDDAVFECLARFDHL
ncbi:hypothetical protein B0H12DRAFT_1241702 [Mycena haematopus]|nr:hypothetical protein B0H12DRAFT_1241702 [Mycena haematopus]